MISGKADTPVYLFISDNKAELKDASRIHLSGVQETREFLIERHGRNTRYLTTGPAGMNCVRTANLMSDNESSVTGGFGAVFGAKNLKAIAVQGSQAPKVAHPDRLKALSRLTVRLNRRDTTFNPFPPDQITRVESAKAGDGVVLHAAFQLNVTGHEP